MHSDLKVLDPIWTPATMTRLHAYMIYDTLFAMDERREIKPQMLERYEVSGTGNAQLEALRGHFARQLDPTKQQAVAREVQVRARQVTRYVPLGQWIR
jgi:hypothetical protein